MKIRSKLALAALLATSLFTVDKAVAATPEEVGEVIGLMMEDAQWHPRVSDFKEYDDRSIRMVFVARGMRYTFYWHCAVRDSLSVWVRPNGTSDVNILLSAGDSSSDGSSPDGQVDVGIGGPISASDEARKFFLAGGAATAGTSPKGVEHRVYWQTLYDQAISETLRRLRHPGDRFFRGKKWHRELHGQAMIGARP